MTSGPLVAADESLTHQIVETFASVQQSDPSWTEKIWTAAHARDGGLQIAFGLGKYTNRGVLDGAAGVSRGTTQWTVRGSRRLAADPDATSVGPIHYEVVEPLRAVRVRLDRNDCAAIAFDVVLRGAMPPQLEQRWPDRSPDGYRVAHDVLRYHQVGVAEGWVEVEGERFPVGPDEWFSVRDHSWGLRPGVGLPVPGLPRGPKRTHLLMIWSPMLMTRQDGSAYELFVNYQRDRGPGLDLCRSFAYEQDDEGTARTFAGVTQRLEFRDDNRRVAGGTITLVQPDGALRPLHVRPRASTGFHLGTGGQFGWRGRILGQWLGELVVDGEQVTDCDRPDVARELHQLRDVLVEVDDPTVGGRGVGNLETIVVGDYPELGLTAEQSFL